MAMAAPPPGQSSLGNGPTTSTGCRPAVPRKAPQLTDAQRRAKRRQSRGAQLILPIRRVAYLQWEKQVEKMMNLAYRVEAFKLNSAKLLREHWIEPDALADLLFQPRPPLNMIMGPTVQKIICALDMGLIDIPSALLAMRRRSTVGTIGHTPETETTQTTPKAPYARWTGSFSADELLFRRLTLMLRESMDKTLPVAKNMKVDTVLHMIDRTAQWIEMWNFAFAAVAGDMVGRYQDSGWRCHVHMVHGSFVGFLSKLTEHPRILYCLKLPFAKKFRKIITQHLEGFISTLGTPELIAKITDFRQDILALDPPSRTVTGRDEPEEIDAMAIESLTSKQLPTVNTRAGLYIYLNSCLVGRPIIDDEQICNLMRNRYPNTMHQGVVDLVLASFDLLSNAIVRKEHRSTAELLRSFLINKVPLLIQRLTHGIYMNGSPEYCITAALSHVDTNTFPTLSTMFDASNPARSRVAENVREEFTFSCVLHGLVAMTSIHAMLGETYTSLPAGGKYIQAALVAECREDPERAIKLVTEVEKTDGNSGAVCSALVKFICQLCAKGDTQNLRALCTQLARLPSTLDAIQLFEKPASLLQPLCNLLDNWKYDETREDDQYQAFYEEFGAILMLVMAFVYRYNLSPSDMGLTSHGSFVAKLVRCGHLSKAHDELSEKENSHVTSWIEGLFSAEGGLTDELMSSCSPQDFYLLVATLFKNMVVASSEGILSDETLAAGIEYLVDTFLMPALVPAVLFLADQLSVDFEAEQTAMIKILHLILKPANVHADTRPTLTTIMNLTAKPLERGLRRYQRRYPSSHQVEPLLAAIKDSIPFSRRTDGVDHVELEAWCSTSGGGLNVAVRQTIQSLVAWSLNPLGTPTLYTHRQILVAIRRMTAPQVLGLIVEELKVHASMGLQALQAMYDVAVALIVGTEVMESPQTPQTTEGGTLRVQRCLSLRDSLGMIQNKTRPIQKKDPLKADILLRLHRLVEEQLLPAPVPVIHEVINVVDDASVVVPVAPDVPVEAVEAVTIPEVDLSNVDMGIVDLGVGVGAVGGDGDIGGEGDLFGGIGGQEEFDWESLDISISL